MFDEKIVEQLKDLVSQFYVPEQFGQDWNQDFELPNQIYNIMQKSGFSWADFHGASKLVLALPELKVAIKIPFTGEFMELECRDGEYDFCDGCENSCCCDMCCPNREEREVIRENYEDREDFDPFNGAGDYEWDYCGLELEYYTQIAEYGFAKFYAKTAFLGTTQNGFPCYIQEWCESYDDSEADTSSSEHSRSHVQELKTNDNYRSYFYDDWVALAVERYGEELVDAFLLKFLREHNEYVGDMHSGNFGFRADGSPVIIDFSDFMG